MNTAQLAQAAKQDSIDKNRPYGWAEYNGVMAQLIPCGSRSKSGVWGRISWSINGKRASKAQVQDLLG